MFRRCPMPRRCLWLAIPFVAGHLGCLALPAATVAIGAPILMPICGMEARAQEPLRPDERARLTSSTRSAEAAGRTSWLSRMRSAS
jgi:hypothetical protein